MNKKLNLFVYKFADNICRKLPGFLNNSFRVYPTKLKIDKFYHIKNTFWNKVF